MSKETQKLMKSPRGRGQWLGHFNAALTGLCAHGEGSYFEQVSVLAADIATTALVEADRRFRVEKG